MNIMLQLFYLLKCWKEYSIHDGYDALKADVE